MLEPSWLTLLFLVYSKVIHLYAYIYSFFFRFFSHMDIIEYGVLNRILCLFLQKKKEVNTEIYKRTSHISQTQSPLWVPCYISMANLLLSIKQHWYSIVNKTPQFMCITLLFIGWDCFSPSMPSRLPHCIQGSHLLSPLFPVRVSQTLFLTVLNCAGQLFCRMPSTESFLRHFVWYNCVYGLWRRPQR